MSDFRQILFRYRGYTPIPFLIAMVAFARPTDLTMLVGALLAVPGELLRLYGVAYAGSLTRATGGVGAPEVVVAGPYAFVRNPLYVGNILLYVGVGVMANALSPWLVMTAFVYFVFQYSLIVSLEEEFLGKEFGAGYEEYRKNVPRFIPRIRPYSHPSQEHQLPRWREAVRSEARTFQAIGLVLVILVVLWLRS